MHRTTQAENRRAVSLELHKDGKGSGNEDETPCSPDRAGTTALPTTPTHPAAPVLSVTKRIRVQSAHTLVPLPLHLVLDGTQLVPSIVLSVGELPSDLSTTLLREIDAWVRTQRRTL